MTITELSLQNLTMSEYNSKVLFREQENVYHSQKKTQSMDNDPHIIANKDFKLALVTVLNDIMENMLKIIKEKLSAEKKTVL